MITDIDRAWAAGIFEGEGSLLISKPVKRNAGSLIATVTSIDSEMVEEFRRLFGGRLKSVLTRPGYRTAEAWTIAAVQAIAFLDEIGPFCRVPRVLGKIDLAREFQANKTRTHRNRTTEYQSKQHEFYERMKKLNQRGLIA